jgi:trimeric autotransporter adhesin
MSTKTTFKRIALVAVAALGFGVLTSVAPASAAVGTLAPTALTVGTIPTAQVGVALSTPITITAAASALDLAGSDTTTINVRVTSAPVGSAFRGVAGASKLVDGTTAGTFIAPTFASGSTVGAQISFTAVSGGLVSTTAGIATDQLTVGTNFTTSPKTAAQKLAGTAGSLTANITPDVAGTYTVLVSTSTTYATGDTATGIAYAAGQVSVSYTFTTGATASSVVLSAVTGAAPVGGSGRIYKATIKDSTGVAAQLGVGETINLTSNSTTSRFTTYTPVTGAIIADATTSATLTSTNFSGGVAYFKVADTAAAAASSVISATGSGTLSATVTGTATDTTVLTEALTTPVMSKTTGWVITGSGHSGYAAGADTSSTTVTSHSYLLSATTAASADVVADINVTDTSGRITGVVGAVYDYALTLAGTTAAPTVASANVAIKATLSTVGNRFTASSGAATVTVTSVLAAAIAPTASPTVTVRGSVGGSIVYTVNVTDQYGIALANQAVTVTTTGRNAATALSTAIATDALGNATYTATDSGTAATVATTDTITFTGTGGAITRSVIWSAAAVSTVTLVTGTEDDTANAVTYRDINASSKAGASAGAATITATVKDVNGSILVGVPVTFTTASTGAAVLSTSVTVYTGALGTAAASVYGWTAGTKTFTATAGAIVASGTVNYRQGVAVGDGAAEVRTIAAVATGNSIVVTASDRYGNPVSGVALYATRTGNGLFGGGSNTNGQTTDVTGTAEFIFNAGSADSVVKITAGSTSTAVVAYGQTSSVAGALCVGADCVSAVFTATTVGTAVTAETGVGAAFAPAGVGSVTVAVAAGENTSQVAADAAAEATDAANAATDAANAAAEAADAATAAAQDAADAVAALSTQVSEMVSALKKQITALTNLVIKIQKKVKA